MTTKWKIILSAAVVALLGVGVTAQAQADTKAQVTTATPPLFYHAHQGKRLYDCRQGSTTCDGVPGTKVKPGGTVTVCSLDPVWALMLNLTVTEAEGPGYLVAYANGSLPGPDSNVNYTTGQTVANLAVALASPTNGCVNVRLFGASAFVIIDQQGWYGASY